jgi:hypothetical protein
MSDDSEPFTCPGCYQEHDGENIYWQDGAWYCRLCQLRFTAAQARRDEHFIVISTSYAKNDTRVEDMYHFVGGQRLADLRAARINDNHRAGARTARVIERGQLGDERRNRPTTLAALFDFGDGQP